MYFSKRLLMYETNAKTGSNDSYDYGEISQVLTDNLVNVSMDGSDYILEAVQVSPGYVPKVGDWVAIEYKGGNPIAKGSNGTAGGDGLSNPNAPVIVSQSDMASGTVNGDHIRVDSIDADHLQAGSVTAVAISANSITSVAISANSIQTQHISANSITGDKIQAGTITSDNILAGSINGTSISANSISTVQLQANSVTAVQISANAVQTQHISANSIIANQIKADQINATHISANSITSDEIQANAVQAQHISANSVTASQISANSVQTQHISSNTITAGMIQANSITTNAISANTINASKLQANSVTATAISANSIQTQHISANTITTSQIQANTITSALISANSVLANHISANQVNATHISANSVTAVAISANAIQTQHISANTIFGNQIQSNQISANHITANAIGASQITANAINANHITANAVTAVAISSNAIQARHISANSIQASMISANQVNATHISANSILSNMISANQVNAQHISANSVQTQHVSANTIVGYQIQANQISGGHIVAGSISTDHLAVGTVQQGLLGQYYTYSAGATNKFQNFKGSQVDNTINFSWGTGSPSIVGQSDNFSVRWQGFIQAPETGQFTFVCINDDTMKVVVNNTQVINTGYASGNEVSGSAISLTAGNWYQILVEMTEGTGGATAILKWVRPSLTKEVIPQKYFTQGNTQIDGAQITTGTITASSMQVGTITAQSGILANASITTANIASGNITSALIGVGEIKTANIASGNITNALIANATIDHAKIASVDASTITVGNLNGGIITASTISGGAIIAQSITGDRIKAGDIDTNQLKAGAIITSTIASGAITTDKIQAGAVTGDIIRAGSITAEHISTIGLDAQLVQVYNGTTGETLIGSGYLRVDGLDVGVVQSDNLLQNGLFLASSSDYGFKRMNPNGEALLGNTVTGVGSHQIWKIDLTSGNVVKTIDVPSKKPFDIAIHPTGNYAYITVQGDNTLVQLDLVQDTLTNNKLNMGMGPARAKFVGNILDDDKHVFVLNTDPDDMHIPDSLTVIDTPPSSVNGDLYVHHNIVLGNNPYDFIIDSSLMTYITMASTGDIVMIDTSGHDSHFWKVKGIIPISAYGTDNNHADLPSTIGLQEVTGGDASGQYNDNSASGSMSGMGGMDAPNGYGTSDGSLRTYEPHGIVQSSDPNTLYIVDYANGELVVVDKHGNAPYNALIGTTAQGSYQMSNVTSSSSPASLGSSEAMGGGPGTFYVRYRIPVGDSPDFIELINGKLFISLGSGDIAVVDEQQILNEINSDNAYYGNYLGESAEGSYEHWNVFQPMRTVNPFTVRTISNVGNETSIMKTLGNSLYVSLSGQSQIAVIDTIGEKITKYINVGTNPKGFDITPDGKYLYVANYGGVGDLSFIYPMGTYIGDPFMALEGGIMYQGADGWTPDRSNWVFDASGNIQSKATVEFHINEPLKNEGGYAKLTSFGIDSQYAQIEQDIINVENYSNGNNVVVVTGGRLNGNLDNSVFTPREGTFISGSVSNIQIASIVSGNTILSNASGSQYTVNYGTSQILFSANAVASGNWVQANYTSPNNIYFKTHNSSVEIAVDNGSSPNFATSFQVDEFVPNFVAVDNRQTSSFTPTTDGINDTYEGLEYSIMTNRALNIPVSSITSNLSLSGGSALSALVDGDTNISGNYVGNASGNQYAKLDLGAVYMIGQIKVWHYSNDSRTYHKTKTEVSEDGNNWTTVFDSAVSGEYIETTSGNVITFNALPARYVRDWTSGNTSNSVNHWVEIQAFGDWQVEKGYSYPSNSTKSGQQIATNGIGFVSTDISKAYVAMNVQINFTSWWWMTYIVGPNFGRIKIEMPTMMKSSHFLNQQASFVNNVAHRHIMSFPPSMMVQSDSMNNIEAGKHRVIIRQDSGKVTLDRLRFDDFQYYNRSTLAIPSQSSPATFIRYKVIAEQTKWYQGTGKQSTEGAYDTPRTNPDTGLPDHSVPIKYRVRVLSQLSPTGNTQERGTVYVTSAIFETGKQSTHWRRSEASDVFAGNKIETWNMSQPMNTGIQSAHLADGAVRSSKILPNVIYDYHVSNYARIQEHKLELNYPTHQHGYYTVSAGAGPLGTDLYIWHDTLNFLNSITGFAGTSGNYGTGNTVARGDHLHDDRYLQINGGSVTGNTTFNGGINSYAESHFSNGTYSDPAKSSSYGLKVSQGIATDKLNVSGNITVTGNITITGTVDGADVSTLNTNVTNHIGSGGSAHAVVTTSSNGFMISTDKSKLDGIQSSAISQATADGRYVQISGSTMVNTLTISGSAVGLTLKGGSADQLYMQLYARSGNQGLRTGWIGYGSIGTTTMTIANENSGNVNISTVGSGVLQHNGYTIWDSNNLVNPATQAWVTGNYYTQSYLNTVLVDATESTHGFLSTSDKTKLDGISANAINQSYADSRYLQLNGGNINGNLTFGVNEIRAGGSNNNSLVISSPTGGSIYLRPNGDAGTDSQFVVASGTVTFNNYSIWHTGSLLDPATKTWVSGNYYNTSTIDTKLVDATESTHGFMSTADKIKLDGISANSINQTYTDARYLQLTGGVLSGGLSVTGNITITGTVDGVDVSNLNSSYATTSANVTNHIGSGGSAHAVVTGTSNGFMISTDKTKLDGISTNAINQSFSDARYLQLTGGTLSGGLSITGNITVTGTVDGADVSVLNTNVTNHIGSGNTAHPVAISGGVAGFIDGANYAKLLNIQSNAINQTTTDARYLNLTGGALSGGLSVTGNITVTGTVDNVDVGGLNTTVTNHIGSGGSAHAVAVSGGSNGFIDGTNYGKLLRIQDNSINQTTTDARYLQLTGGALSGGLSVTGNITVTGTVDGVDVSSLNTTVTNHIGSGGSAHAVAISGGANGFIDGTNYGKLLRIQDNSINQTTADGRYYIQNQSVKVIADNTMMGIDTGSMRMGMYKKAGLGPVMAVASGNSFIVYEMNTSDLSNNISGTSVMNTLLNINSSAIQYKGNDIWYKGTLVDPATQTWISGNYYNQSSVTTMVNARGDTFQANSNTFTNLNTFTNAGLSVKIQPSTGIGNTTKLLQVNNTSGNELFSVNYSGGVSIAGDFTVTGQQIVSGTTNVNGDYSITGQLIVGGNSTLGDASTDVTTVNGTLKVSGNIEQIGAYQEVHRRPLFGIAGDLQFQTSSTTFDTVVDFYDLTKFGSPSIQTGATRYYRIYAIYSDDINSTQTSGGQQATLRIAGSTSKDLVLNQTWGSTNGRRDWYSTYFTDLPTGNGNLQAMLAQSGNNLGIRWIELIAYDKF